MALIRFSQRESNPPAWLAMLHGFLAAAGLTLLAFTALTVGIPGIALAGLALLLVAAGGGVIMNLGYQLKDVLLPKWLVGLHAVLAVTGFVMVLWAAFGELQ